MKRELNQLRIRNKNLAKLLQNARKEIRKMKLIQKPDFLTDDQWYLLGRASKSMKGNIWSNTTIKRALQIRFACGTRGYEELLSQGYPLPSLRTLYRRTEHINFESGVLKEVFEMLSLKVSSMSELDRFCCLTIDEMSISPGEKFDAKSDSIVGQVTLPQHSGSATKALVAMLGGVCTRWKQTVGYWFTSNSCDGKVFYDLAQEVITDAHNIGLRVLAITNDMGTSNMAMWKKFGVKVGKNSDWITSVPYPFLPNEDLFFLADDPHLVKNIKAALCNGQDFVIPGEFVIENDLPSCVATISHIKRLLEFDAEHQLKLVPGLDVKDLDPAHFQKMNVGKALRFISRATSAALSYLVEAHGFPEEFKTTAWFLDTVRKWFDLISSRTSQLALSKLSEEKHGETTAFLKQVIELFMNVKIGIKGAWKPIQTGVVTTTKSLLGLQDLLLNRKGVSFVMTSRFSQDALENLFSQVRFKNPTPSALEFKTNLRAITIAQFLTEKKNSNYQNDESDYRADFLKFPTHSMSKGKTQPPKLFLSSPLTTENTIHEKEIAVLKYVAGYTLHKVKKKSKTCEICVGKVIERNPPADGPSFTKFRDYTGHSLFHIQEKVFQEVFLQADLQFR